MKWIVEYKLEKDGEWAIHPQRMTKKKALGFIEWMSKGGNYCFRAYKVKVYKGDD